MQAILGLLPPYSLDDVKFAYRGKALETHPDRGGTMDDFLKVREAYERAVEFVEVLVATTGSGSLTTSKLTFNKGRRPLR